MQFNVILRSLIVEGIYPGVSSILSFIPVIALLYFILTLIKDSGIAGKHVATFLLGFGCSVPAILAAGKSKEHNKRLTLLLIPYMSCSAKLPIYAIIASSFFPHHRLPVIISIYLTGICFAFAGNKLLNAIFPAQSTIDPAVASTKAFTIRRPSIKSALSASVFVSLEFVKKAFTVILVASVIIWLLENINTQLQFTNDINSSLLAHIGAILVPLFSPIGFGDWRIISALLTGLSAKEAVISTLAVIAGSGSSSDLYLLLSEMFSPLSAFCFMVFCLLYTPCLASLIAVKNVTGGLKFPILVFAGQTSLAWIVSFLIFNIGTAIIQLY